MEHAWIHNFCGQRYDTLPMSYAFSAPFNWFGVPEGERATRTKLSADICIIDDAEHYVRGCLEVPVLGTTECLIWGVWVSVSPGSLQYIQKRWNDTIAEDEPPRFGWLCNWISGYPEPREIQCHVYLRSGKLRPRVVLQPTDYPLPVEQHHGITLDRVKEIAAGAGHG